MVPGPTTPPRPLPIRWQVILRRSQHGRAQRPRESAMLRLARRAVVVAVLKSTSEKGEGPVLPESTGSAALIAGSTQREPRLAVVQTLITDQGPLPARLMSLPSTRTLM